MTVPPNSTVNDEVLDSCIRFAKGPSTGLGVMLFGEWGCGKTWYVKHRLLPALKENRNGKPMKGLYVSLNGRLTKEEVLADLVNAYVAEFGSESAKTRIQSILDSLARTVARADIDHWAWKSLGAVAAGLGASNVIEQLLSKQPIALVFDDYERCRMDTEVMLGMINQFAEHLKVPVFLIGNLAVKCARASDGELRSRMSTSPNFRARSTGA